MIKKSYGSMKEVSKKDGAEEEEPSCSSLQDLKDVLQLESIAKEKASRVEKVSFESFSNSTIECVEFFADNFWKMLNDDFCLLVSLILILGVVNISVSYSSSFFPQYALENHNATGLEIGVVIAALYFTVIITGPIVYKLIEITNIKPTKCLWLGIIVSFLVNLLFGLVEYFPKSDIPSVFITECFLLRMAQGVAVAFVNVSVGIIATQHTRHSTAKNTRQIIQSVVGFGYMSGPPIGGLFYFFLGWALSFTVVAVLHVLIAFVGGAVVSFSWTTELEEDVGSSQVTDYTDLLYNPLVIFLVLNNTIGVFEFAYMHPTLGIHLSRQVNYSEFMVGIVYLIRDIGYCLAILLLALIQKITGPFVILTTGHVLCAVGYLLLGPAPFLGLNFTEVIAFCTITVIGIGVACPMVSTIDSLMKVISIKQKEDQAMSNVLNILSVVLNSAFYTGSLLGALFGGAMEYALGSIEYTYTVISVVFFLQGCLVVGFSLYIWIRYSVTVVR